MFFIYNVLRIIYLLYKEYHPTDVKPSKLNMSSFITAVSLRRVADKQVILICQMPTLAVE